MIPKLFIIGSMKCGTTTLHYDISKSIPGILTCDDKEPDVLSSSDNIEQIISSYDEIFKGSINSICMDSSTSYAKWPTFKNVPYKLSRISQTPLIIYIVRDPLERIISHINHDLSLNLKSKEDIDNDIADIGSELYMYSDYQLQISKYEEYFSNILIIPLSEYRLNKEKYLIKVAEQFGLTFNESKITYNIENSAQEKRKLPVIVEKIINSSLYKKTIRKLMSKQFRLNLKLKFFPASQINYDFSDQQLEHIKSIVFPKYTQFADKYFD